MMNDKKTAADQNGGRPEKRSTRTAANGGSLFMKILSRPFRSAAVPVSRSSGQPPFGVEAGQATSEMVFILPLLIILAGGAICIVYMCWQGVKTQEAANYAARIEGQERVSGGVSADDINRTMGLGMGGDKDPTLNKDKMTAEEARNLRPSGGSMSITSVYGKYRDEVRKMFSIGERDHVHVMPPVRNSLTDQVKVVRVMTPPKIFNFQMDPVMVASTAYGGECTNAYGLPCWAHTGDNQSGSELYWQKLLRENPGNDKSQDIK